MGNNPISSNFNERIFVKFYEINFIYVILDFDKGGNIWNEQMKNKRKDKKKY